MDSEDSDQSDPSFQIQVLLVLSKCSSYNQNTKSKTCQPNVANFPQWNLLVWSRVTFRNKKVVDWNL